MLFGGRLKKYYTSESVHTHRSYGQPPELSEKYRVYRCQMNIDTSSESRKVVKDTEKSEKSNVERWNFDHQNLKNRKIIKSHFGDLKKKKLEKKFRLKKIFDSKKNHLK